MVNNLGELHDWVEATRPHRFGWIIEQFVQAEVTTKLYFAGRHSYAVDKRSRNDQQAFVNRQSDVVDLGQRIAQALSLEVGSIDMVGDNEGRLWPRGYPLLAEYLISQVDF